MKFNKAKCKVLQVGRGYPKHKYRLGREWLKSSSEEKDLRLLVEEKLSMTQQRALTVQKANISWAASKEAQQAGCGRGFCPSVPLWRYPTWSIASSSGTLSRGKTWTCWTGSIEGHKNGPREGTHLL